MSDVLVVASKVKAFVKTKDLRTSAEFIDALSKKIEVLIEEATKKTIEAKRQTVFAEDL